MRKLLSLCSFAHLGMQDCGQKLTEKEVNLHVVQSASSAPVVHSRVLSSVDWEIDISRLQQS